MSKTYIICALLLLFSVHPNAAPGQASWSWPNCDPLECSYSTSWPAVAGPTVIHCSVGTGHAGQLMLAQLWSPVVRLQDMAADAKVHFQAFVLYDLYFSEDYFVFQYDQGKRKEQVLLLVYWHVFYCCCCRLTVQHLRRHSRNCFRLRAHTTCVTGLNISLTNQTKDQYTPCYKTISGTTQPGSISHTKTAETTLLYASYKHWQTTCTQRIIIKLWITHK